MRPCNASRGGSASGEKRGERDDLGLESAVRRRRRPAERRHVKRTIDRRDDSGARRHALPAALDRERLQRDPRDPHRPELIRRPLGGALIRGEPVKRGPIAVSPRTYSSDLPPRTLDRASSRSASRALPRGTPLSGTDTTTISAARPPRRRIGHLAVAGRGKSTRRGRVPSNRHGRPEGLHYTWPVSTLAPETPSTAYASGIFATPSAGSPARRCSRASRCCRLRSASARTRPSSRWWTRCCCGGCR